MSDIRTLTALNQRVWYIEGGVHPTRSPQLLALGKFSTAPSQKMGEAKKISAPDPNNFQQDIQVGTVQAAQERASLAISVRSTVQASILMGWKMKKCRVDLFALSGKCGNPQDFTEGGEKWIYFPDGRIGTHAFDNFGAWGRDEDKETDEKVDMTAENYYEYLYMNQEAVGGTVTVRPIYTMHVYDGGQCEQCPDPSAWVMCTMAGSSATPGTQPMILFAKDSGYTWSQQTINQLFSNEDVADGDCVGGDLVLVSNTGNVLLWTDINMLYMGQQNTWQRVANGFVKNKGPRAMWNVDARHIWMVGDGGYVYFCQNYKVGVTVQDAGVATTSNLRAVHARDTVNAIAVGDNNTLIHTENGGDSWEALTGPATGINLGACWMWDNKTWFVGEGAGGNGNLWLTTDGGYTWSKVGLPATYLRIDQIKFISEAEGYMLARSGGQSYVLRTITAGNEWIVTPQGRTGIPVANSVLSDVDIVSPYSNIAFAVGTNKAGTGGVIIRMAN